MSIRKSLIALGLVATALSAVAAGAGDADRVQSIQLKDGTTMHHYKDGKMAMEDKNGKIVYMKEGVKMETTDGKTITMTGNEVARLYMEKYQANRP
ncbi:CopK family periplasmic copper-binding protein [Rhodoferax sp.]|uniref:CopK family periplasmic copper-binding protein n=1 Tax=Rhodoferax sp. TaxID=50421 RepID=UPI0025F7325A|nr:CopK family periplasmic copper-binding protein [Rhodoferax sp.]MCM2295634.1 CopK family periplasmic copper-binding protein [Rhodoferax sp.]